MRSRSSELKSLPYELFIAVLSVLSIINIFLVLLARDPMVAEIVSLMNGFFTVLFIGDFAYRLATAKSRWRYFWREFGWADLLACVPLTNFKILRVFRLVRVYRLARRVGKQESEEEFRSNKANSALLGVLLLLFILLEFGGAAVYLAERGNADANIKDASDAIWFTYVTMTTVGYGDRYPVTDSGRFVGMVIMAAGVGLFGALTGYVANAVLAPRRRILRAAPKRAGMEGTLADLRSLLDASKSTQDEFEEKLGRLEQQLRETRHAQAGDALESQQAPGGEGGIRTPEPGKPD